MYDEDTIAAISTATGVGGIGIVRISGDTAVSVADMLFRGRKTLAESESHRMNYGRIVDPATGETVDEVLAVKMKAPHSFTREDVVEIHCHGGPVITRRILELVLKQGVRPAEPGEFTKRAFLNGRIDLSQAEAVIDIITAKTDESAKVAVRQLEGNISRKIGQIRDALIELIAHIEVTVDYPEHDLEEITGQMVYDRLQSIRSDLMKLLSDFERGRVLREGISIVLAGRPNVGKSSLLNELSGKNRAIVTNVPGTTRDIIEEYINIKGVPVRMADTAGIRETSDIVEKIGVEKTHGAIEEADLVILLIDADEGIKSEDLDLIDKLENKKLIVLINKIDLVSEDEAEKLKSELEKRFAGKRDELKVLPVSALEGTGIDKLEEAISEMFLSGRLQQKDEVLLTNVRHKELIDRTVESIDAACASYEAGMPIDCITIDIRSAADYLGQITGESVSEQVIDMIFSRFCVGK